MRDTTDNLVRMLGVSDDFGVDGVLATGLTGGLMDVAGYRDGPWTIATMSVMRISISVGVKWLLDRRVRHEARHLSPRLNAATRVSARERATGHYRVADIGQM